MKTEHRAWIEIKYNLHILVEGGWAQVGVDYDGLVLEGKGPTFRLRAFEEESCRFITVELSLQSAKTLNNVLMDAIQDYDAKINAAEKELEKMRADPAAEEEGRIAT